MTELDWSYLLLQERGSGASYTVIESVLGKRTAVQRLNRSALLDLETEKLLGRKGWVGAKQGNGREVATGALVESRRTVRVRYRSETF